MKNKFILGTILMSVLLMSVVGISAQITGDISAADCNARPGCSPSARGGCYCSSISDTRSIAEGSDTGAGSSSVTPVAKTGTSSTTGTKTSSSSSAKRSSGLKGWEAVEAADPNVGTCYVKSAKSGRATGKFLGFMFRD